ncbi:MAG: glycosyl hydrolase [Eubacteriales bacterium]|nr:glycosyl hydrolase [Eubacteriales bacterium]
MKIDINTQKKVKTLKNFWNHMHHHPTDCIEDDWGKEMLTKIAQDKVAQTVRIYTMFEDMVSMDEDGNLQYDFTLNDKRMDFMVEQGFNLFVGYNFIPPCIAVDPHQFSESERYKDKKISNSYPRDYKLWEQVCREYTEHIVERYGIELVSTWRMQCFNEPDMTRYWVLDGIDTYDEKRAMVEYNKLYDHFAKGVKAVSSRILIGGPSLAGKQGWLDSFFTHITKEKNYATGEIGAPLDFFAIHTYGISMKGFKEGWEFTSRSTLDATFRYYETAKKYGLEDRELIVDEWGLASTGFRDKEACPQFDFRNREFYSAHFAKFICDYVYENAPVSKVMMCVCGTYGLTTDFMGFRSFFTLNRFPKPIYNAYVLTAKLGTALVECGESPEFMGVFPTTDTNGKITIMTYYTDDDLDNVQEDKDITLSINGIDGIYKMTKYCIDETHCNSYTKFKELGSPYNPDQWQREVIGQAGKVAPMEPPCGIVADGKYEIDLNMTNDSMYLIELEPVK